MRLHCNKFPGLCVSCLFSEKCKKWIDFTHKERTKQCQTDCLCSQCEDRMLCKNTAKDSIRESFLKMKIDKGV
jgi:hypothetical protein